MKRGAPSLAWERFGKFGAFESLSNRHFLEPGDQFIDVGHLDARRALGGFGHLERLEARGDVDSVVGR